MTSCTGFDRLGWFAILGCNTCDPECWAGAPIGAPARIEYFPARGDARRARTGVEKPNGPESASKIAYRIEMNISSSLLKYFVFGTRDLRLAMSITPPKLTNVRDDAFLSPDTHGFGTPSPIFKHRLALSFSIRSRHSLASRRHNNHHLTVKYR